MKNLLSLISLIVLFCGATKLQASGLTKATTSYSLTGVYTDNIGTVYYLYHLNDEIFFVGENPERDFGHVFYGKLKSHRIDGHFYDIPKFKMQGQGAAAFQYNGRDQIKGLNGAFTNIVLSKKNKHRVYNKFPLPRDPAWGSGSKSDLDGVWDCTDGGRYYVRQYNNTVVWFGETNFKYGQIPKFANVGVGQRSGNQVQVRYVDLPKGEYTGMGAFDIAVTGTHTMEVAATRQKWIRVHNNSRPPASKPATVRMDPVKPTNNKLTVYYGGYSTDNILYIKNLKSKGIQKRTIKNGKVTFNLSPKGGEYGIYKDTNPPKADALPNLKLLKKIKLKKGEKKTIRI